MDSTRKRIGLAVRIMVSIGVLLYLFYRIDWQDVTRNIQSADYKFIVAAFFATQLAIFISGIKWHILCKSTSNVGFWESLRWYYIGFFFSNFLPGSIGGDAPRIYYASKKMGLANAVASITVERVFAGIALVLTALIGFIGAQSMTEFSYHLVILTGVFAILYIMLFNNSVIRFMTRRFGKSIQNFYQTIDHYKNQKRLLWKLLAYSVAFQFCFVWITDLLYRALGVEVNFLYQLAFVAIISAITMIPVSVNGLGVREGSYSYFFAIIGIAEATSITVSLLFYVIVLLATSVGGLFWIIEKKESKEIATNFKAESLIQ
ncbi:hypothetical protein BHU72_07225 [Desulfuribacillus stibiiarsenatis]|uniref:Phosphatidylglycerol lysyltransferase n=1 Tax=Desulfuribacillus stibiiarsenatis TaxID=1390249 RepID=A0A1E5L4D1_9FIRM|nr:lysylphosphatidylglycerol synthase transmembrane domain-containing protein [Desulfuribacillus stibiiarsenatis]OEH84975.1 hypothetical protein BHU72_07225 [Desulfuribacillus stibiiarsenatis]